MPRRKKDQELREIERKLRRATLLLIYYTFELLGFVFLVFVTAYCIYRIIVDPGNNWLAGITEVVAITGIEVHRRITKEGQ